MANLEKIVDDLSKLTLLEAAELKTPVQEIAASRDMHGQSHCEVRFSQSCWCDQERAACCRDEAAHQVVWFGQGAGPGSR